MGGDDVHVTRMFDELFRRYMGGGGGGIMTSMGVMIFSIFMGVRLRLLMDTFYADIVSHLLQVLASTMTVSDVSTVLCLVLLFRLCGVRQPPQTDLECLGPSFSC